MPRSRPRLTPTEAHVRMVSLSSWLKHPDPAPEGLYTRAEYAEAVDEYLAADEAKSKEKGNANLALWISKDLKDALVAAAQKEKGNLTDDVDRGFRLFVAGKFTPRPPIRSRRGANVPKANLNVRPSGAFREQVEELLEVKSAELGWKVTVSRVAVSYLLEKYDLDEEEFTVKSGTGTVAQLYMSQALRTHFRQVEADRADVSLDRLAEDGLRAALAGEFVPPKSPRTPAGTEAKTERDSRLNVWVDAALYKEFQTALPVLSARAGYQVSASGVALEWMKRQLGEPAAE